MKAAVTLHEDGKPCDKIIIAKFEHGYLKKGAAKNLKCSYKKARESGSDRNTLTIQGDEKISYVSQAYNLSESRGSRYYVGCLNKKTGKMSIHDAEMFHMRPTFVQDKAEPELVFREDLTYGQQIDRLNATFGSSKKKKAVNARQKFSELVGEKYSAAVDTTIEHAVSQSPALDTTDSPSNRTSSQADGFMPLHNPDVANPRDVYTAAQLISPQSMTALATPAEVFFKRTSAQLTDWTDAKEYPWYILDQLQVLPVDERQRWETAKCLVYLQYMIKLFHYKPSDFKQRNCLPVEWPTEVKKELLDKFTMKAVSDKGQKAVRYFPARLKDKLLLYILAMSLILDGAQLDPTILIQDLAVPQRKVLQFYRSLGCTVSTERTSKKKKEVGEPTVVLKLPFTLPSATKQGMKRGGSKRNIRT